MKFPLKALALTGCLATSAAAAGPVRPQMSPDAPPPPRVVTGPLCGGEDGDDCEVFPVHLRATAAAPHDLRARPDDSAPMVGRVRAGEPADIIARQTTYVPTAAW
ncbi:hypothetical protein [Phenylobacterium sp.]|uniref:hypothetical protein n=1 Tax=Phenylobacterium sp. TaxID=1871053 RepID=UPI003BA97202